MKKARQTKVVSPKLADKFVDVRKFLRKFAKDDRFHFSSNLNPESLSENDFKKHAAIYVSYPALITDEQFAKLCQKKLQGIPSKTFQTAQKFIEEHFVPFMSDGDMISAELMGVQNKPYNHVRDICVLPHGLIHVHSTLPSSYEELEKMCEEFCGEGFVAIHHTGERFKVKREYFPSKENPEVQRGGHGMFLSQSFADLARIHLQEKRESQRIDDMLFIRSLSDVIEWQKLSPFDGIKMLNLLETTGQGKSYRYCPQTVDTNGINEYQQKFDGETVLVRMVGDEIHLMIKIQVDVYKVGNEYRLGWI